MPRPSDPAAVLSSPLLQLSPTAMPTGSNVRGSVGSSGSDSPLEDDGLLGSGGRRAGTVPQQHKVGWMDLSWLMLTDVVGTSVLAFAGVAAALGWALSVSLIVLACPVAVYTAILMARSYRILQRAGLEVGAMGEAARHTLGGARGARLVYVAVYGFALRAHRLRTQANAHCTHFAKHIGRTL